MRTILAILILSLPFAACGKKGALQPPPAADQPREEPRGLLF